MKRMVTILSIVAACAAPSVAGAAVARSQSLPADSVSLRARSTSRPAIARTPFRLTEGVWYVATVSGTVSYYSRANYTKPRAPYRMVCGRPQYFGEWPFGLDAEFTFARPWTASACTQAHLPVHWRNFQALSAGGWSHPDSLGPRPTAPTANHTYQYVLRGHNRRASFRLTDIHYGDNYGRLRIALRPAAASDCGDYWSFHFASAGACQLALSPTSP